MYTYSLAERDNQGFPKSDFTTGCARFPEILQNCVALQVFGRMCLIVFLAFTLKLPIQTLLSVVPTHSVFWRTTISTEQAHPWYSTALLSYVLFV